ncbi:MAG: TolC family protein [Bacteroidales bacterium]|nr:TolC family protein [Bacteroidales bacterium]
MIRISLKGLSVPVFSFFFICGGSVAAQQRQITTLDELWHAADSSSLAIAACQKSVEAAASQLSAARAALLPDVAVSATVGYLGNGYGWGRDSNYSFSVHIPHFSTQLGLNASQIIYAGGRMRAAIDIANQSRLMSTERLRQVRQDVHFQLAGYYLDLYRMTRQTEVYEQNILLAERMIEDIRARQEQGTALRNDMMRYELQLSELRLQQTTLANNIRITSRHIASLAGLEENTEIVPDSASLSAYETDVSIAPSVSRTPRLKIAEIATAISQAETRIAHSALMPTVTLLAQDNLNGPVTIDIQPYDINYNFWYVGVGLHYDIASLYKRRQQVKASQALEEQRQHEQEQIRREVSDAIEDAAIRLAESQEASRIRERNMDLASLNYTVIANQYKNGLALLTDMLDASTTKLTAELDMVSVRIAIIYNLMTLDYLQGRLQ